MDKRGPGPLLYHVLEAWLDNVDSICRRATCMQSRTRSRPLSTTRRQLDAASREQTGRMAPRANGYRPQFFPENHQRSIPDRNGCEFGKAPALVARGQPQSRDARRLIPSDLGLLRRQFPATTRPSPLVDHHFQAIKPRSHGRSPNQSLARRPRRQYHSTARTASLLADCSQSAKPHDLKIKGSRESRARKTPTTLGGYSVRPNPPASAQPAEQPIVRNAR
jgi:hypothetical protein